MSPQTTAWWGAAEGAHVITADKESRHAQSAGNNSGVWCEKARGGVFEGHEKPLRQGIVPERFRDQHISTHMLAVAPRDNQRRNFVAQAAQKDGVTINSSNKIKIKMQPNSLVFTC
jgi:hypothetical protein